MILHQIQPLRIEHPTDCWDLTLHEVEVGVLIFDVEHRAMLEHLRRLFEGVAEGRPKSQLRQALTRLVEISEQHFAHEEDYMRMLSYPAYRQHTDDHRALRTGLQIFMDELFAEGASAEHNRARVSAFFRTWLLEHILEHDRSLANFLVQKGIR